MAKKNTQRKRRVPVDLDTRLAIAKYLDDGLTILQIANILGRHHNVMVKRSFSNVHERPKTLLYQCFCHF
ncbi:TPA: hypothetical protein RU507_000909 [Staphylococcus aureus]|nr:hypothetical protein [Staphylococcus aureus]HDZ9988762.1 hypothetical protein [Staphylococcus aureus]HEA0028714.1 hypothetical protein [Staphylococcus aureus]HEA0047267.1 hypothetical protein [Staphylococcus aureus]HEA0057815.1 hypothetical protein [Staphylococcus aureus]